MGRLRKEERLWSTVIVASLILSGYIYLAGSVYCPAALRSHGESPAPPPSTPSRTSGVSYVLLMITAHSIKK